MKRLIMGIFIFLIILILTIVGFVFKPESKKQKLVVAEVAHSIFYAPWYVALSNNYFNDLDIDVVLTSGANNVVAALLSGDAQIGLCGPEALIYVYKDNKNDYIKAFSALTKRDGQFLVLKNNIKYNSFKDLEGKTILAGRSGGMPLLNFKKALENEKVENVKIDSSVEFANLSSAFIAGDADGVNLFEPNATLLVKNGYGFIADAVGKYSGIVPYTTFNAKKSFIKSNKDIIKKFYQGIKKGLDYCHNHNAQDIAKTIKKYFPDIKINDLTIMIDNYKKANSWFNNPNINEEAFKNLEDIMIENKELDKYVLFKDLVHEID